MIINDLKEYFENVKKPKFFLTDVFSWRGIYSEVAFTPSIFGTKEESLRLIDKALTEKLTGYKGGEYSYSEYTNVHFENEQNVCNDIALFDLLAY